MRGFLSPRILQSDPVTMLAAPSIRRRRCTTKNRLLGAVHRAVGKKNSTQRKVTLGCKLREGRDRALSPVRCSAWGAHMNVCVCVFTYVYM